MKIIVVTCWTKVNMAYQTSLDSLSILLQGFTEVFPVLFVIFIMGLVVAPLKVTSSIGNPPHSSVSPVELRCG